MRKLGVKEWLVSAVMSMYIGAKTVVRTVYGNSKGFEVKVGMHQGSGLSPLLFVIVILDFSRPRGRPKKTWKEVVREDCQARKLNKEDAMDRCKWRKVIKEAR